MYRLLHLWQRLSFLWFSYDLQLQEGQEKTVNRGSCDHHGSILSKTFRRDPFDHSGSSFLYFYDWTLLLKEIVYWVGLVKFHFEFQLFTVNTRVSKVRRKIKDEYFNPYLIVRRILEEITLSLLCCLYFFSFLYPFLKLFGIDYRSPFILFNKMDNPPCPPIHATEWGH